jgi:hypothetical protein
VCFDDGSANGQTHSYTLRARRKERLEKARRQLLGDAYTGIADGNLDLIWATHLSMDFESSGPSVDVRRGFKPVCYKIQDHLLKLNFVAQDLGQIWFQICLHRNAPGSRPGGQRGRQSQ